LTETPASLILVPVTQVGGTVSIATKRIVSKEPKKFVKGIFPDYRKDDSPYYPHQHAGVLRNKMSDNHQKNLERFVHESAYPIVAGYNDPLTCIAVVRELLMIAPSTQIRAKGLSMMIAVHAPRFVWTSQTVGRILGGLHDLANTIARASDRQEMPYLDQIRLGSGNFYILWDAPQTYLFLYAVLDALYIEFNAAVERVKNGGNIAVRDSIWLEIESSVREDF
jgi:hypothetical protein